MKRILSVLRATAITALAYLMYAQSAYAAGALADVYLYDRSQAHRLPVYEHDGRYYVAGRPGNAYEIVVSSKTGGRVLAVTSVDGVNVVSGEDALPGQTGYVIEGYGSARISGWRKSLQRTAAFYFSSAGDSYAARTGRPWDLGVVGVALFREKAPEPPSQLGFSPARPSARARPEHADGGSAAEKLGTGYGPIERSPARYTEFIRASEEPEDIVSIYYDSYENLAARGIVPARHSEAISSSEPDPFPGQFVPSPP